MIDAKLNSARKRVNQKIRQIVTTYGKDSPLYQTLEAFITKSPLTYHRGNLKGISDGVIQISGLSKSKDVALSTIANILQGAEKLHGVKETRDTAKRQLTQEGHDKITQRMITRRAKDNQFISTILTDEKKAMVYSYKSTRDFFQSKMTGNKGDQKTILEVAKKINDIDFNKLNKNIEEIIPQSFDD